MTSEQNNLNTRYAFLFVLTRSVHLRLLFHRGEHGLSVHNIPIGRDAIAYAEVAGVHLRCRRSNGRGSSGSLIGGSRGRLRRKRGGAEG